MLHTIQCLSGYGLKQRRCSILSIIILGGVLLLFYFRNSISFKSFELFIPSGDNSNLFHLISKGNIAPTLPTLCVITRIYWAQISYFPVLALSLYHSGPQNIRIYVVNTDNGTNIEHLQQTINFINKLIVRQDFVTFLHLGQPSMKNDFGYEMTDRAIDYLYKQYLNSSRTCDYVTFTNGDNFYSRNFVKKLLPYMKAKKDIIAYGFVSHHYRPQYKEAIDPKKRTVPEIVDYGTEKCFSTALRINHVDLGAVTYRLSFLQKHNFHFRRPDGSYLFGSDGYFVEDVIKHTNTSVILRQTLFVHQ